MSGWLAFAFVAVSAVCGGAVAWFVWTWIVEAHAPLPTADADALDETGFCDRCGCGMSRGALGWRCSECGHAEEGD